MVHYSLQFSLLYTIKTPNGIRTGSRRFFQTPYTETEIPSYYFYSEPAALFMKFIYPRQLIAYLFVLMNSSWWFDSNKLGMSIDNIEGLIKKYLSRFVLANSVDT